MEKMEFSFFPKSVTDFFYAALQKIKSNRVHSEQKVRLPVRVHPHLFASAHWQKYNQSSSYVSTLRVEWTSSSWWLTPRKTLTSVKRNQIKVTNAHSHVHTHTERLKAILNLSPCYLHRFKWSRDPFSGNNFPHCWLRNKQQHSFFLGLQSGHKPSHHETAARGGRLHVPEQGAFGVGRGQR